MFSRVRRSPQGVGRAATNAFTPASSLGIGPYEVTVRAVMPGGLTHAWSAVHRFQVETSVVVPPPGDFTTPRPTLRWNPVAGAVRYDVVVTDTRGAVVARAAGVTGTVWTLPRNLAQGTYRVTIRGVDAAGRAAQWSLPTAFRSVAAPRR